MFLTNILLKKAKSKAVMVLMESVVSGHQVTMIRERLADKLEFIRFDPYSFFCPGVGGALVSFCLELGSENRRAGPSLIQLVSRIIADSTRKFVQGEEED